MASIRDKIIDLVSKNQRVALATDMYFYLDYLSIDTSDKDVVRLICKFNTNAHVQIKTTFSTPQHGGGLIEVILPYNKIYSVEALKCSDDLLEKFKREHPDQYHWWSKVNYVEGVFFNGGVMPPIK